MNFYRVLDVCDGMTYLRSSLDPERRLLVVESLDGDKIGRIMSPPASNEEVRPIRRTTDVTYK